MCPARSDVVGANNWGTVNDNRLVNHHGLLNYYWLVHYHYGLRVPDGRLHAPSRVRVTASK